jgi:hypothetical protein
MNKQPTGDKSPSGPPPIALERVGIYNAECAKKYYADDMEATRVKLGLKDDPK